MLNALFVITDEIWQCAILLRLLVTLLVCLDPALELIWHFIHGSLWVNGARILSIQDLINHVAHILFASQNWNHVATAIRVPASPLEIFGIDPFQIIANIWLWVIVAQLDLNTDHKGELLPPGIISGAICNVGFSPG